MHPENLLMKKILLPHQYYYPHMDLFENRSTVMKEKEFLRILDCASFVREAMIYVHIPFCDSKCAFCGFDKVYALEEMNVYIDRLLHEIDFYSSKKYVQQLKITSIHFGGGTPTILSREALGKIIDRIKERFDLAEDLILNIEGSASTMYRDEIIELIHEKNVSRVSIGVQTFHEPLRKEFKVKASLDEVYLTLSKLRDNQIIKYIDILFGNPDFGVGNMMEIMKNDIRKAIEFGVDGIDFSQLYPFYNVLENRIKRGEIQMPSSEEVVQIILEGTALMEEAGYKQTTAYGFIRQGNIIIETSYYGGDEAMPDCIALGSGAFGKLHGYKYRNNSYNSYIHPSNQSYSQIKKLTDFEMERTHIVGFPRVLSLSKKRISEDLYREYAPKFQYLIENDLVEEQEECFELTKKGKCFVDNVYYFLIDDAQKSMINHQLKILTLN